MSEREKDAGSRSAAEGRAPSAPDRLIEHDYDGIQEFDNPMPGWWLILLWATVVFSALYFVNVPGVGSGKGRIAAYEAEMARAQARYGAREAAGSALTDADLLALVKDPAKLALGKTTFTTTCSPCHRPDGGGLIGPNLTDDYWLHGGRPTQILHTVTHGVPDKGMPAWGPVLKPEQLPAVVAYVIHLHDTHPPNPKAPQGAKEETAPEETK